MARKPSTKEPKPDGVDQDYRGDLKMVDPMNDDELSRFNDARSYELQDGIYYKVTRENALEARLTEVVIKNNEVIEHKEQVDVARIILGKLIRRVGDTYGVKP